MVGVTRDRSFQHTSETLMPPVGADAVAFLNALGTTEGRSLAPLFTRAGYDLTCRRTDTMGGPPMLRGGPEPPSFLGVLCVLCGSIAPPSRRTPCNFCPDPSSFRPYPNRGRMHIRRLILTTIASLALPCRAFALELPPIDKPLPFGST